MAIVFVIWIGSPQQRGQVFKGRNDCSLTALGVVDDRGLNVRATVQGPRVLNAVWRRE